MHGPISQHSPRGFRTSGPSGTILRVCCSPLGLRGQGTEYVLSCSRCVICVVMSVCALYCMHFDVCCVLCVFNILLSALCFVVLLCVFF